MSASFKSGTTVSYTFKEPHELSRNSSARPSSVHSDTTLRGEDVSLSFRTNQSPALLLYVSSRHGESLALLINKHGEEAFILKEILPLSDNLPGCPSCFFLKLKIKKRCAAFRGEDVTLKLRWADGRRVDVLLIEKAENSLMSFITHVNALRLLRGVECTLNIKWHFSSSNPMKLVLLL